MADYVLIPISAEDAEVAGITEYAAIESFVNERGEITIRTLGEIDGYACGYDCDSCVFDSESCENKENKKRRDSPYVCRGRIVNPGNSGEVKI